ncbi:MAG TPA: DinB family protein [Gemmatimonadales bacterium]|nr:DinB family protein [Gemmatimonadales bacterium]
MTPSLPIDHLVDYTDWQRATWHAWFQNNEASALAASTGPNGDGRFTTVGALVRHIFSAELRYVERIRGTELTDAAAIPTTEGAQLFALGARGRLQLRTLLATYRVEAWDTPIDIPLLSKTVRLTPRKILLHVVTHEIRHWAQVATLLRQEGWKVPPQDLLFSPVYGDPIDL